MTFQQATNAINLNNLQRIFQSLQPFQTEYIWKWLYYFAYFQICIFISYGLLRITTVTCFWVSHYTYAATHASWFYVSFWVISPASTIRSIQANSLWLSICQGRGHFYEISQSWNFSQQFTFLWSYYRRVMLGSNQLKINLINIKTSKCNTAQATEQNNSNCWACINILKWQLITKNGKNKWTNAILLDPYR